MSPIGALKKHLLHRRKRLTATLKGVAGHTGGGAFDYISFPEGYASLEVAMRGVAGTKAQLFVDGRHAADLSIDKGHCVFESDTRSLGRPLLALPGDVVEVRQHEMVILHGELTRARRLRRMIIALFSFGRSKK